MRVVHGGESRSATLPWRVFADEWDPAGRRLLIPLVGGARTSALLEIEAGLRTDMQRMELIITSMRGRPYTIDEVIDRFRNVANAASLGEFAARLSAGLEADGQPRTARAYRSTVTRLRGFLGGDIPIEQLSAQLLADFQSALLADGCSPNTVSFYMRNLRAIYRKAVTAGLAPRLAENIFDAVDTEVHITRRLALTPDEFAALAALDPTAETAGGVLPESLAPALALFLFSFHACGMDFIDMAFLKRSDVRGKKLRYTRNQTGQQIIIPVSPAMRRILDWFAAAQPPTADTPYVFPIITDPDKDELLQYRGGMRLQNIHLKKIASMCRISTRLSSSTARHTWAADARRRGLSLAAIADSLGYHSRRDAQKYLDSVE